MLIEEIFIYPVKGCAGISLDQAILDDFGLQYDRRYQVVDADNRFFSQRNKPIMCRISTSMINGQLTLHYPGVYDLKIQNSTSGHERKVVIWDDEVLADDMGDESADWLSSILGEKARLVQIGSKYDRKVRVGDSVYSTQVHFGDSQPLLIISKESLDDLNSRLDVPISMDRFRPNLVISGLEPYGEDKIQELRTDSVHLKFTKKCARCTVTTIDQNTGISGSEPLRTLTTYRKEGSKVFFGAYYLALNQGVIKQGEQIRVY